VKSTNNIAFVLKLLRGTVDNTSVKRYKQYYKNEVSKYVFFHM
jgi:hypothetical protein